MPAIRALSLAALLALAACVETTGVEPVDLGAERVAECAATRCETLDLDGASLDDYRILSSMTHVRALMLSYTDFDDLADIAGMTQLEELHIGQTNLTDLSGLSQFPNLRLLHAQGFYYDPDLSPIGGLTNLRELAIGGVSFDLALVNRLPRLTTLKVYYTGEPLDLTVLRGHPALATLDLGEAIVTTLQGLGSVPRLRTLTVPDPYNDELLETQIEALRQRGISVSFAPVVVVC
jgi:Leucine-rich repeat (LRR) protein